MKCYIKILLSLLLIIQTTQSFAKEEGTVFEDGLKDVYTVFGIGLGGAVLGLSTLSFAEEPKDNLKNIVIGGAIGVIIGVGIVAYSHATKGQAVFREKDAFINDGQYSTKDRAKLLSSVENTYKKSDFLNSPYQLNLNFNF